MTGVTGNKTNVDGKPLKKLSAIEIPVANNNYKMKLFRNSGMKGFLFSLARRWDKAN